MPDSAGTAVFLSYASQDAEAAKRICDALRTAGVEVWLDQEGGLVGGDAWDRKIREQISSCALFIPLISENTQARKEGYFRLEWKLAEDRSHLMAKGVPFIVPVSVDGTTERGALVPDAFTAVQWTRLPGGETSAAFCERVKKLLGISEMEMGRPRPVQRGEGAASPTRREGRRAPAAVGIAAIGIIAALVTITLLWRRPAGSTSTDKSIAVLPFENLSDDKENTAFFSDGMHEDILTTLANIRDLRVVSRTSVMEYRGTKKKIPQIARELGVAYILEGSVRRAGNQVRITGQLIRAANDEHLWAKSYDRELTPKEMFAIQAALSTEIAGALHTVISPETKKLLERRPTENLEAYDLYLKSRTLINSFGNRALRAREKMLQDALALDPNFAAAWGELGANHAAFVFADEDHTPERLAQADAAIARAVRLAPDAPEVIAMLGRYALLGYRDYARAIAQFEKLAALQPNNVEAWTNLGYIHRRQGNWMESVRSFQRATELEVSRSYMLIDMYVAGRRWDDALAVCQQWRARSPEKTRRSREELAQIELFATGSTREFDALKIGRRAEDDIPSPRYLRTQQFWALIKKDFGEWKRLETLLGTSEPNAADGDGVVLQASADALEAAVVLAAHGETAEARSRLATHPAQVRAQLELDPSNAVLWSRLALMEALLGEKELALQHARKAIELMPVSRDRWAGPSFHLALARVCAWVGEKEQATTELADLLRIVSGLGRNFGRPNVHALPYDPYFAPLHGDPRFEALLKDPKNNAPLF